MCTCMHIVRTMRNSLLKKNNKSPFDLHCEGDWCVQFDPSDNQGGKFCWFECINQRMLLTSWTSVVLKAVGDMGDAITLTSKTRKWIFIVLTLQQRYLTGRVCFDSTTMIPDWTSLF